MCHPHRHTDHGNPRETYGSSNPILECSVMTNLQKKEKVVPLFFITLYVYLTLHT
jgi:hypothetical protein